MRSRAMQLLMAVGLGGVFGACTNPVSVESVCDRGLAYARRCPSGDGGTSECMLNMQRAQCVSIGGSFRSEFITAVNNCYTDTLPCGMAGQTQLSQCSNAAAAGLTVTQAQRDMAQLICERCAVPPALTMEACVAMYTSPPADGGSGGLTLSVYSDSAVAGINTCLRAIAPMPMAAACQPSFACLTGVLSPGDAGTCP